MLVEIGSYSVSIVLKDRFGSNFDDIEADGEINFLLKTSNESLNSGIDEIFVDDSAAIDAFELLKSTFNDFKVDFSPKMKLKFSLLTDKKSSTASMIKEFKNAFTGPLDLFKPVLNIEALFQIKYYSEDLNVDNVMKIVTEKVDRGRDAIFNFVLIDSANPSSHYIPNWGVIVSANEKSLAESINTFLQAFTRYLKISSTTKSLASWFAKVQYFYLKQSLDLIHQLDTGLKSNYIICPPHVFKEFLVPAAELVSKRDFSIQNTVKLFELLDRAFHHQDLVSAAFFPEDHKIAIYLPAYLPLFLPILVAFLNFLKEKRKLRAAKRKETVKIKTN